MNRSWIFLGKLTLMLLVILALPFICGWVFDFTLATLNGFESQVSEMFNFTLPPL